MKKEKSCGAVIIKNRTVLLAYQQNGFWSFPKGHIEDGETEPETARREVKEETGLDVIINKSKRYEFSYIIKDLNIDKTVVLFLAEVLGEINFQKQESEIAELKWLPFNEVEQTLNFPEWREVWRTILADLK